MHRQHISKLLESYARIWISGGVPYPDYRHGEDLEIWQRFCAFVESQPSCFERSLDLGHVTGSALVVSSDGSKVLLLLHRKLNKWLQLGGHSDGNPDPMAVAKREAHEESGLAELYPFPWHRSFENLSICQQIPDYETLPFDLDIHEIPARKSEAAHLHFDVRFLFQAGASHDLIPNEEAKDLRWLSLDEAVQLTNERSMRRQFDKLKVIQNGIQT